MTRVAAVDCGTNSLRLLVADVEAGALHDVERAMTIVRLGQGVDRTGEFAPEALERTRVALAGYAARIGELQVHRVRMVATSASRDVGNREEFRRMVRATLGAEAEVISGDEEAALSFAGAVSGVPGLAEPVLVADIGGGSTELVLGDSAGVRGALSSDIGCVRLTERHLADDPPTPAQIGAAEADIRAAVERIRTAVDVPSARTFVGLAGSVTTVAALALGLPEYDPDRIHASRIPVGQVRSVTAGLLSMSRAKRAGLPVLHPGRVDVIGAGALVLRVLMDALELDEVVVSEHDILDGIAMGLAAEPED